MSKGNNKLENSCEKTSKKVSLFSEASAASLQVFEKRLLFLEDRCKAQQVERSLLKRQLRTQKQSVKRVEKSREAWKAKYQQERSLRLRGKDSLEGVPAKGHQYSIGLVWLVVQLQRYGRMSFRGCVELIRNLAVLFQLGGRVPSASSVRNWCIKVGHYRLNHGVKRTDKWVIWVDESVMLGQERVLLILGCPEKSLDFKTPLRQNAVEILSVSVQSSWKGEAIAQKLCEVAEKTPIAYIVSDQGNNLRRSYKEGGYIAVSDCSHAFARALESLYEDSEPFTTFCTTCNQLRKKWILSQWAAYMPPVQRTKARFMNVAPLFEWAKACLERREHFPIEVQTAIAFLTEQREWIEEFWGILQTTRDLTHHLKIKGFSIAKKDKMLARLELLQTPNQRIWAKSIQQYLETLANNPILNPPLSENNPERDVSKRIFCCSDIIESTFGKFKLKINTKNPQPMTPFLLTMANFGTDLSQQTIQEALQEVKNSQIRTPKNPKKPSRREQKKAIFGKKVKPEIVDF
jgi:hypothetical protein